MQKFVIYSIRRIGSEDAYIGSSLAFRNRWKKHRYDLRRGKHHCLGLQKAWAEFGPEAFSFEVMAEYECETVNERAAIELQWIIAKGNLNAINDHVDTHNIYPMSEANRRLKSAETHAKIAAVPEYASFLAERGKAIASYMKSPEGRAKMAEHSKRRWQDPEERKRLRAGIDRWVKDPEAQALHAEKGRIRESTPERIAHHKANTTALWENEDYRAKVVEKAAKNRWSDPEKKAIQAQKMREYHARRRAAKAEDIDIP